MSTQGVKINRGSVGPGQVIGDGNSGMIMHGVAAAGIALGEVKELRQLKDAEALGLTKAYDAANNIRVWYQIKEFYAVLKLLNITGVPLYIMLVDNTVTATNLDVTLEDIFEDAGGIYGKKLLQEANGLIRLLGGVMNPATTYTSTLLEGLDADVRNAITKAQALADWAGDNHMPISIILEGREYNGLAAAAVDLRADLLLADSDVLVTIGQDWDYADGLDALGQKHANVGAALGAAAALKVNENIGEVQRVNLQDVTLSRFVTAGLSSHQKIKEVQADWDTLDSKGFVFVLSYDGYAGLYFNDDHTCTPITIDDEGQINVHNLNLSRTNGKIRRVLRNRLLPKVKTVQEIDATTGKLAIGSIKFFEAEGNDELLDMELAGEIVTGVTSVDPDSDLRNAPRELKIGFSVVNTVTVGQIQGTLNQVTKI